MILTPERLDALSASVLALYEDAQLRILSDIARRLSKDVSPGQWQLDKLAELRPILARAAGSLPEREALVTAILAAYRDGSVDAVAALTGAGRPAVRRGAAETSSRVMPVVLDLLAAREGAHARILRDVADTYRDVVTRAVGAQLMGAETRQRAMQRALSQWAERGITGFTDRAGRSWEMSAYVEMATRTGSHKAAQQGHVDTLVGSGHDLVMVSDHAQECPECAPFEGQVLSLTGLEADQAMTTLDIAQRRGLNHPNCRHRLKAYFPGITKAPDKGGRARSDYEARQRQRYLERGVRQWKRREAAAIDPVERAKAKAKVTQWRGTLREHVEREGLKRQPQRESPMRAAG